MTKKMADHYPKRMTFFGEPNWPPGCSKVFSLGLTNIHVATAIGLLLIDFVLSFVVLFIITVNM